MLRRTLPHLLPLAVLLAAGAASAQAPTEATLARRPAGTGTSWDASFPAERVGTHLRTDGQAYVVVPAGARETGSAEAARALETGLRATGRTGLVMDAAALGDVATLDDAALVQRCAKLPVQQVAVVRVFPGGEGQPATAVVTLYDTKGALVAAFSAQAGQELATAQAAAPLAAGQGVSSRATDAVAAVAKETPATDSVRTQYEEQYVSFDDYTLVSVRTGQAVKQGALAYQGKFKKPLQGRDFYKAVGRKDLEARYAEKNGTRTLLLVGGGAAAIGGIVYGIAAGAAATGREQEDCQLGSGFEACVDRNIANGRADIDRAGSGLVTGLAISAAGAGVLLVGALLDPHPVPLEERRRLADAHNRALRERLGLPEAVATRPRETLLPRPTDVQVDGGLLPGGGAGMVLRGRF